MNLTVLTKWSAAFGISALVAGGIASPALADVPISKAYGNGNFAVLAGVGSDTTQDVGNGLSAFLGRTTPGDTTTPWLLASYDAVGSSSILTKRFSDPIMRYNGSGNGRNALLTSIGQLGTTGSSSFTHSGVESTQTTAQLAGKIQFSRSSSGPGAAVAGGVGAYVPFAQDAMTYAVNENSVIPELTVGVSEVTADGDGVVPSTLWAIYKCVATHVVVSGGVGTKLATSSYQVLAGETLEQIHAYQVQAGSGTAEFWSTKFYGSATATLPSCVTRAGVAGETWAGKSVQEHDASVLQGDIHAIMPFSIPQWVAQGNNVDILADTGVIVPDRRGESRLGVLNGIEAITGVADGDYALNPAMVSNTGATPSEGNNKPSWLGRTMYHIVPTAKLNDVTTPEYAMFGEDGLICTTAGATIEQFGFAQLPDGACGVPVLNFAPSASSVTVSPVTNITSNTATTFSLNVEFLSNGNQGGTVSVEDADGNVIAGVTGTTIAANSTKTTVVIPVGVNNVNLTKSLTVYVTPNLSGIAEASTSVTKFTPVVTATSGGAKKGKTGKATVTIGNQGYKATGTVEIYNGVTRVGTGTLANGTVTITVAKMSKGTKSLTVKYLGDANYAPKLDATLSYRVK